jgi:hypothetical protein
VGSWLKQAAPSAFSSWNHTHGLFKAPSVHLHKDLH